ncbi:MAG: rhamnulokinase [Acidimicrobiales bacterium]
MGASNTRLFTGRLQQGRLVTSLVMRQPTRPVRLPSGLHWDLPSVHQALLEGLAEVSRQAAGEPLTVGIDSWGVDYGLLDTEGRLLGLPFHYRDSRTEGQLGLAEALVGPGGLFEATGTHEMEINTVFQLMAEQGSAAYEAAAVLLMVPDLMAYFLTGQRRFERTIASTSQLVDVRTGKVAHGLLRRLGLRTDLFAAPVSPGEAYGPVLEDVAESVELRSPTSVVAVASHDTASAVLAIPAKSANFAYVSSGTWSLVGLELPEPVINDKACQAGFSNELGAFGAVRFLRNVMGHWMLQECERSWALAGRKTSTAQLVAEAATYPPFATVIDVDDPMFSQPGNMPARIRAACAKNHEPAPETDAGLARAVLDSMALAVASALDDAQDCAGRSVDVVHVVGGGSANDLLLSLIAAASGLEVVAGPVEASAIGNLLVQLHATGQVAGRSEMRALVARSFPTKSYQPDPDLLRLARAARRRYDQLVEARASRPSKAATPGPGGK